MGRCGIPKRLRPLPGESAKSQKACRESAPDVLILRKRRRVVHLIEGLSADCPGDIVPPYSSALAQVRHSGETSAMSDHAAPSMSW
ncbi:MAG: hypothetical protein QOD82_6439 [Pseudonocardiales bacterium]|nr:hypothetical protein [Pseudonocardiales bacterium]